MYGQPDKAQTFTVIDAGPGDSKSVLARRWQDALDIYARIEGFLNYRHWRDYTGRRLTVYDAEGRKRPRNLLTDW